MKIKVTDIILDYEGKPAKSTNSAIIFETLLTKLFDKLSKNESIIKEDLQVDSPNLIWREAIFVALNSMDQQEQMTTEQKTKSYQIITKAYATNEPDFTVEERAYIIERIGKFYSPLVYGRAKEIFEEKKVLDGAEEKKEKIDTVI